MEYAQTNRPLRVDTVLGQDVLLLDRYRGSEALSRPFSFTLDLLSEETSIQARDILGTPIGLHTVLPDGEERSFHGRVSRFGRVGRRQDLTAYRAEVVPWLWFLSLSKESRIFQEMSVLEIVETVFSDLGWSDFDIRCTRPYPPRTYCVQYRETHLAFVSRLLEEEGIFYFFEHEPDRHTLVLADDNSAFEAVEGNAFRFVPQGGPRGEDEDEDVVRVFTEQHLVNPNRMSLRDYDYLQPSFNLEATLEGDSPAPEAGSFEVYDYPGAYLTKEEGDRYARLRLEAREATNDVYEGEGTVRAFRSGGTFELRDPPSSDLEAEYLLTSVTHGATSGQVRSAAHGGFEYSNVFTCIPADVPFRPERVTRRPVVHGTQTALVVGKAGEEIWVDKNGRIKIQFHWDRQGQKDENSSCWVRVAVPWGGKGWGSVSLPRIGNEVVVAFEEGDPDRPLVVGSVYNAEQTPPFTLPDSGIQMGMKSRSSPGGGGHNEISMTDTKGEEMMNVHAQYDMNTTVGNDVTEEVGNNRTASVATNDALTVGADQTLEVGGNREVAVGGNESVSIGGDQAVSVSADRSVDIGANGSIAAGADLALEGGANVTVASGADTAMDAAANFAATAGANLDLSAGAAAAVSAPQISISADGTIEIACGGSSIKMTPASIEISAPTITVSGSGMVDIKGGMVKVNS